MATLHLRSRPVPDPAAFCDHTKLLSDEEKAILSLRGFADSASMMLPAYHLFLGAQGISESDAAEQGYPFLILHIFLRHSMLDTLALQLRRLYDTDERSLGGGRIAELLERPDIRSFVIERALSKHSELAVTREAVERHLAFVHRECRRRLTVNLQDPPPTVPQPEVQMALARRTANKRGAHMTLDDYAITKWDLHDLVFDTLLIATAIQRVMGDDSYCGDYQDVDKGAYEASKRVLGSGHGRGLLLADIEANLDMRVARI